MQSMQNYTSLSPEEQETLDLWGLTVEDLEQPSTIEGVSYDLVCAWCHPGLSNASHIMCEAHRAQLQGGAA